MGQKVKKEEWLALRKDEAKRIDPATARVMWAHGYVIDPYDIHDDLTDDEKCIGRCYFARNADSDIWVSFDDLPENVEAELWDRYKSKLVFPTGLLDPDTSVAA
jgi:hypothetical protein